MWKETKLETAFNDGKPSLKVTAAGNEHER